MSPERDVEDLARNLLAVLEDKRRAAEMGREAYRTAERVFNLRTQSRSLEEIYDAVVDQHRARHGANA
jgi:glycosyltransferase involved in cell wall biosynthesis